MGNFAYNHGKFCVVTRQSSLSKIPFETVCPAILLVGFEQFTVNTQAFPQSPFQILIILDFYEKYFSHIM